MSLKEYKKIAVADVLYVGPEKLEEKLSYFDSDAVVWDPVMRVADYAKTNTVSGYTNVEKFFTWLANLPPVNVEILSVFGEKDKVSVEWKLVGGEGDNTFEIPCVNIYDFKDDKICGVRMHFDSAYFAEIIGK